MPRGVSAWHSTDRKRNYHFGVRKAEDCPSIPCPRCGNTMTLLWRKRGRQYPCLLCPNGSCRLRVVLVADGGSGFLPSWNPRYYHRKPPPRHRHATPISQRIAIMDVIIHARRRIAWRHINEQVRAEENVLHTGTVAEVAAALPQRLRLIRARAMIGEDDDVWSPDNKCPACDGTTKLGPASLDPCPLCGGFAYVPRQIITWWRRQNITPPPSLDKPPAGRYNQTAA